MKLEHAELVAEAFQLLNPNDEDNQVKVITHYSGRGMYGKNTAAVTGSRSNIIKAIAKAAAITQQKHGTQETDYFIDTINLNFDNMGKDIVVY